MGSCDVDGHRPEVEVIRSHTWLYDRTDHGHHAHLRGHPEQGCSAFPIMTIGLVPVLLLLMSPVWHREVLRSMNAWACREGRWGDEEGWRARQVWGEEPEMERSGRQDGVEKGKLGQDQGSIGSTSRQKTVNMYTSRFHHKVMGWQSGGFSASCYYSMIIVGAFHGRTIFQKFSEDACFQSLKQGGACP